MNLKQILEVERDTMDDPHPDFDFDPVTPIRNLGIEKQQGDSPAYLDNKNQTSHPDWMTISPHWKPGEDKDEGETVFGTRVNFRRMYDIPYMSKKDMYIAVDKILTSCKEILSIYNRQEGRVFYRGSKFSRGKFSYFLRPSEDRTSVDTPDDINQTANYLMKSLGFSAIRSNSFFVNPSWHRASEYGLPCVCFPIDGFNYTWSKNVNDFYNTITKDTAAIYRGESTTFDSYDEELLEWFKNKYEYQNTEIDQALYFKNEVMISAPCVFIPYIYNKAIQKYLVPDYEY